MKQSYIYAIVTVVVWSTAAAVVKALLTGFPNLEALTINAGLAVLVLLVKNIAGGNLHRMKKISPRDYGAMIVIAFGGMFLYNALYYYGLSVLTSQEACILNYLWPVMLVIFSCLILKEKVTAMKIVAILCSFAGIVVLSLGGGGPERTGSAILGMAACIIAAACYGLFCVLNKKLDMDQNIAMMLVWLTVFLGSAVSGLVMEDWIMPVGIQWAGFLWMGIVANGFAYLLWALALQKAKNTAVIANLAYLTPFLSLVVSAIFLKEHLSLQAFAAVILIVGGILLQSVFDRES